MRHMHVCAIARVPGGDFQTVAIGEDVFHVHLATILETCSLLEVAVSGDLSILTISSAATLLSTENSVVYHQPQDVDSQASTGCAVSLSCVAASCACYFTARRVHVHCTLYVPLCMFVGTFVLFLPRLWRPLSTCCDRLQRILSTMKILTSVPSSQSSTSCLNILGCSIDACLLSVRKVVQNWCTRMFVCDFVTLSIDVGSEVFDNPSSQTQLDQLTFSRYWSLVVAML